MTRKTGVLTGLLIAAALVTLAYRVHRSSETPLEDIYASIKEKVKLATSKRFERLHENAALHLRKRSEEQTEHEYIRGKIVMLDGEAGRLDSTQRELPDALRASTPEEVGTIVLLEWTETKVGKYILPGSDPSSEGHGAYQRACDVTIIDRKLRVQVGLGAHFEGAPPPPQSSGPARGSWPTDEVIRYVSGLPRIPMDARPQEDGDEWTLDVGMDWVALAIPVISWTDVRPEGPILIQLPDDPRIFEMLPSGALLLRGEKVSTLGRIPASRLIVRARDAVAPVRVKIIVRRE